MANISKAGEHASPYIKKKERPKKPRRNKEELELAIQKIEKLTAKHKKILGYIISYGSNEKILEKIADDDILTISELRYNLGVILKYRQERKQKQEYLCYNNRKR